MRETFWLIVAVGIVVGWGALCYCFFVPWRRSLNRRWQELYERRRARERGR